MDLAGDFFRALLDQAPRSATARLPTSVQLNRMHTNIKCCNHVNGWKYGVAASETDGRALEAPSDVGCQEQLSLPNWR